MGIKKIKSIFKGEKEIGVMDIVLIQHRIYEIRGEKVILDRDLAEMYGVETRRINEAVKRNIKRFPSDFVFQLTEDETQNLISQIATSRHGGTRKPPYAFTEQGVAMLSGLLNSDVAISVNISIMRAFVAIRHTLINMPTSGYIELKKEIIELKEYINEVFTDYNDINEDTRVQLELINQSLAELQSQKNILGRPPNKIGYIKDDK